MDINALLKEAWDEVLKADLPEHVQVSAFNIVVQFLAYPDESNSNVFSLKDSSAAKKGKPVQRSTGTSNPDKVGSVTGLSNQNITEEEFLAAIVEHTGVDRNKLEKLIQLHDGQPKFSKPAIKSSLSTSVVANSIASILTVVRNAGLNEDVTPWSVIRAECSRLKRLDEKNFTRSMNNVKNTLVKGDNKSRALKPTPAAFLAFPSVVNLLLGVQETE